MKQSDRKEVLSMITDAVQSVVGDLAAYMNYYNERLDTIEELHGVEVEGYGEFMDKYGSPEKIERTIVVHLESKGHHNVETPSDKAFEKMKKRKRPQVL